MSKRPRRLESTNMCEKTEQESEEFVQNDEKRARRLGRVQFILVALLFVVVICITEGVSYYLGKTAGTVALVIVAALISGLLYRDEIKQFFKK